MNSSVRSDTPTAAAAAEAGGTRLSGRWLLAARAGWLFFFAVTIVPFVASLPGYFDSIKHPSPDNAALSPGAVEALARAGITLDAYAWASLVVVCIGIVVSMSIALLLFVRRGDDWMALLVSLFLVIYDTSNAGTPYNGVSSNPDLTSAMAFAVLQAGLVTAITFGVFLLFPSGRFVPWWSRVLFVMITIWAVALSAVPTLLDGVLYLGYPLVIGATIACIVYRYRRASTPLQRQQTKWVVAGFVTTLIANQAFWLPSGFTPLGETIYPPLFYLAYQLLSLLVPITFFIAIQRYRLYEIDTLINRALVYGSLTAVLVATYAACVIGAQALLRLLAHDIGAEQPVVIVATTLLIAALFRPLRARLQALVDRRFYRRKYDAAATVAAFSATLRQELNLAALRELLVAAVDETMQPAHVSLCLLTPAPQPQPGANKEETTHNLTTPAQAG